MTTLDSIKFKCTNDTFELLNKGAFLTKSIFDSGGNSIADSRMLSKENKNYGLKNIEVYGDYSTVEVSAKILRDNYSDSISINTLDRMIDEINSLGVIKINNTTLDSAELLRCDVTKNIKVNNVKESVRSLLLGKSNTGFKTDDYQRENNLGITFTGRQKTYKNRQIYYDKTTELNQAKNKGFLRAVNGKVLNDFKDILRVEQNLTSLDRIRKSFKVPSTNLIEVLKSKENPNLERHNVIVKYANQVNLFDEFAEKDIKDAFRIMGTKHLIKECNNSLELAIDFLKSFMNHNRSNRNIIYRYIKQLKEDYASFMSSKMEHNNTYHAELLKIGELLKVA